MTNSTPSRSSMRLSLAPQHTLSTRETNSEPDDNELFQSMTPAAMLSLCERVLPLLCSREFCDVYWTYNNAGLSIPDCYLFNTSSQRCFVLEVVAKFMRSQLSKIGSYLFRTHDLFESILHRYTLTSEKPNPALQTTRPWDVAVNLVMKVEALINCNHMQFKHRYLLNREYTILCRMWDASLHQKLNFDEMVGLPMVFDYKQVRSQTYDLGYTGLTAINEFGHLEQVQLEGEILPGLSYMTMEKLGPTMSYLIELMHRSPMRTMDLSTALKIFDQLICRLFQVHRLCVSHNSVSPQNLYMGRGVAYNTLYLSGFSEAHIVKNEFHQSVHLVRPSTDSVVELRHEALNRDRVHPAHDLESAFYILIELITGRLPWDAEFNNESLTGTALVSHIHEVKKEFWSSESSMIKILSSFAFSVEDGDVVATILVALYAKLREILDFKEIDRNPEFYCNNLGVRNSVEFKVYADLRKCALVCFRFDELSELIDDTAFKTSSESFILKEEERKLWNLQEWCFSNISLSTSI